MTEELPTLPCPIALMAAQRPSDPAILSPDGVLSYGDYYASVRATAEHLGEIGIRRGAVVGIVSQACVEYVVLLMALFRLGAVASPLSPRWPPKVTHDALLRTGCHWVVCGGPGHSGGTDPFQVSGLGSQALDLAESVHITRDPKRETRNPVIDAGSPATIVFTSGSTGEPKAAVHFYGNHYFNAAASNQNLPFDGGDGWLLSVSLHHVAGLGILFRCLLGGGAIVIPSRGESIEDAIGREGVTHVSLVPTQLYRLLRTEVGRNGLKRLKAILVGGSAVPASLIHEAAALRLPILTTYGLTEAASQVTTTQPGDPLDRLLTSGTPLVPGTVTIAPDGEILVRGKTLFMGYLKPAGVERPMTSEKWFGTGDLGRLDGDGYLSVVGRKDNMFVCGGENIQPEEVEKCLCRLPGLRTAVVVPVPDAEFGYVPVAFVAMESGYEIDEQELAKHLTEELPRGKIPRRFLSWPRETEPGDPKVNRNNLAALARMLMSK